MIQKKISIDHNLIIFIFDKILKILHITFPGNYGVSDPPQPTSTCMVGAYVDGNHYVGIGFL